MAKKPEKPFAFLQYSRSQQLGLLIVWGFILVVGVLQLWSPFSPPAVALEEDWATYAAQLNEATKSSTPESFSFDPNTVSKADLIRLGLKPWVADSWLKYRGKRNDAFRKAEDIRKLYRLDSVDADRLIPLISIATSLDRNIMTNEVASSNDGPRPDENQAASFLFDPNLVTKTQLIALGLSDKQAAAFIKYRDKAPPFSSPNDLDRIRVLNPQNLRHLKPLVDIAPTKMVVAMNESTEDSPATYGSQSIATPQPYVPKAAPELASIDINTALVEDWQLLPGIGLARSEKIMRFRALLGGFYSIDQVGTTYGIPDSVFQQIRPFLQLENNAVRQLKINILSAEALAAHPYISRKIASILVKYRQNHGSFRSETDLTKIRILKPKERQRLLPYLDFSN